MYALSGTPGTGKSTLADALMKMGFPVCKLADTCSEFAVRKDRARQTTVIDEDAWAASFPVFEGVVEGHLAHLLTCDRLVILRCHPDLLRKRLEDRGYPPAKVAENVEAEALDVILIEAVELQLPSKIMEIDTSREGVCECAKIAAAFFRGEIPGSYGSLDWSSCLGGS